MNDVTSKSIRTDLAMEAVSLHPQIPGVTTNDRAVYDDVTVNTVEITSQWAADELGRPIGRYVTVNAPKLFAGDREYVSQTALAVADQLKAMCGPLDPKRPVLLVGLGNDRITPDSLGPRVARKVSVTRHVTQYLPEIGGNLFPLCAVAPGVLGVTGVETSEVVKGVTDSVMPQLVIAVDALASRSTERISTTIQLADTGIQPGSGIGPGAKELTQSSLGVRVIAIGVPTVVHASTISQDAVELLLEHMGESDTQKLSQLVGQVVSERIGQLVVTPKEIDKIIDDASQLIAEAIDIAIHGQSLKAARLIQ